MSYRPPEELKRPPTYFELFGDISPEEKAKNQERIDYLSSRADLDFYLSPEEVSQLQQDLSNNVYNDELYKEYDKRVTYGRTIAGVMGEDYNYLSSNFTEAKQKADQVYMQSLQNDLSKAKSPEEREKIQSYIDRGPLDFDNKTLKEVRDANLNKGYSEDKFLRTALNAQAMVMGDFLQRNDIPVSQRVDISYEDQQAAGRTNVQYLNTGTLAHMLPESSADANAGMYSVNFEYDKQPLEMGSARSGDGELGTYSMYTAIPQVTAHDDKPWLSPFQDVLDVLSVIYPPLAPVFQGVSNLAETEDLDEALKTAGTVYVGSELVKGLTDKIDGKLSESGVEIPTGEVDATTGAAQTTTLGEIFSDLPEPVKNITTKTLGGVISGQDPKEALVGAVKGELTNVAVDSAIEGLNIDEDKLVADVKEALGLDPDFELPEPIQNIVNDTTDAWVSGDSASDAFDSSVESEIENYVGGVAEDVIKEGAGVLADALPDVDFETPQIIKDIGDTAVDLLKGPVELIGDVFEPVGEVVETGADVVQQVTEPVVDLIDEGLDYVGTEYVDPALQAIDEALPHGTTPELPEGPDVDVDLPSPDINYEQPESQVAGLFDKELGKIYKHDIIELPKLFSDERIQGMLSRKYRI